MVAQVDRFHLEPTVLVKTADGPRRHPLAEPALAGGPRDHLEQHARAFLLPRPFSRSFYRERGRARTARARRGAGVPTGAVFNLTVN